MFARIKNKVKEIITDYIGENGLPSYYNEVTRQKEPYQQWILKHEKKEVSLKKKKTIGTVSYQDCGANFDLQKIPYDYIIFSEQEGIIADNGISIIFKSMKMTQASILYGDEDCVNKDRKRSNPWFRPQWSPDTLQSFFYFGSIFAVDKKKVLNIQWKKDKDYRINIYDFVLKVTELEGEKPVHIDGILYHYNLKGLEKTLPFIENQEILRPLPWGSESVFSGIKEEAEQRKGYKKVQKQELVSIIIPSKDNPNILDQCLNSLISQTNYSKYEIIVVDNGSNEENKLRIAALQHRYNFKYLWKPMEFNFSKMCNLGAKEAKGTYLLLLNDDIEIIQSEWLTIMVDKVRLPHVGAVGAKLLYPETRTIQHIGITNLEVGPAHKLVDLLDDTTYYYGQNLFQYNMIGVTGACLLVTTANYRKLGGLSEELKIAYNDVDFCFRLLESGLYNLQCNNAVLIHHESYSRGDDRQQQEKYIRLLEEKEKLYQKHPQFRGKDPFYSKYLISNSPLYLCNYQYEHQMRNKFATVKPYKGSPLDNWYIQENNITIDFVGIEPKLEIMDKVGYLLEGWSYLRGLSNDQYKRWIILEQQGKATIKVSIYPYYRKDVIEILPEETHIELAGFVARIPKETLEIGIYTIGMLAKNKLSNHKVFVRTKQTLEVI